MNLEIEYPIPGTAQNFGQFPKFDIPSQNTKKFVFCNGISNFGNCPKYWAVPEIQYSIAKHQKTRVLQWNIKFRELPKILGSSRKCVLQWNI